MSRVKGPIAQDDLVPLLKELIDAASAKNSSAHKDIAKHRLREVLETANWRTPYIYNNLSTRRCKFIAAMGYWVPSKWMLLDWKKRPGVDKGEIGE